jgi:hypothetical protein
MGERADAMTLADSGKPYESRGKSPAEIEHDIAETRAELGAVLDTLERRLAPRQLVEHGIDRLRDTMKGKGGGIIGETLRGHPVPLALIGAGIGWLVVAGTAGERLSDAARQVASKTRDLAGGLIGGEAPLPDMGEAMAGCADARPKPRLNAAVETAAETAGRARDGVAHAIDDYPLALGILGLVAGAALAMMLPASRIEERLVGPVRERVRERADALCRGAVDRAEEAASAPPTASATRSNRRRAKV